MPIRVGRDRKYKIIKSQTGSCRELNPDLRSMHTNCVKPGDWHMIKQRVGNWLK